MVKAAFFMEQHIGHFSFYQSLRQSIEQEQSIVADWVQVSYRNAESFWHRLSFLPEPIRGTLIGRSQVVSGLQQNPSDVVFFNTQVPAALGQRHLLKRPYVLCTDITPIQYDQMAEHYNHTPDRSGLLQSYKHWVNRSLFQNAQHSVAWSTWVKDSLVSDYNVQKEKITVIPPGVDLDYWKFSTDKPQHERIRILFVGGDFDRKGGRLLLKAAEALGSLVELHLVTRTDVAGSENVKVYNDLKPNTDALISLFGSCDLFAFPTRAEAFGIAAVEACASGLPVIATKVGGLVDIVKDNETGFLIESDNIELLIEKLRLLAENPVLRARMSRASRDHAVENFDAKRNGAKIAKLLAQIGEKARKGF